MSGRVSEEGTISVSTAKWYNPVRYREKLESVRVPKKCPDEYRKMVQSMCVTKNCTILAITEKRWNPCEYRKSVRTSIGRGYNQCEYRKMVQSDSVSGKARIRPSTEKVSGRVSEEGTIYVRNQKLYNPGDY